jgi:hypothetical protein
VLAVSWSRFDRLLAGVERPEGTRVEGPLFATSVVLAALALGASGWLGFQQDYAHFCAMWDRILQGNDPWVPMDYNVYGPEFNLLAPLLRVDVLAAKALFAGAWVFFGVALARAVAWRAPASAVWPFVALLAVLANVFWWVEIAAYGHFDMLHALPSLAAACWLASGRDGRAGVVLALAILLKYQPAALAPVLFFRPLGRDESPIFWDRAGNVDVGWMRRRLRTDAIAGLAIVLALGFGLSYLAWGWSTFTPLAVLGVRTPKLLSIAAFLDGPLSPLGPLGLRAWRQLWLIQRLTLAFEAVVLLRYLQGRIDIFVACALSALVSTLFYPVGYPQYETLPLTLLFLAWIRSPLGPGAKTCIVVYASFLAAFNGLYFLRNLSPEPPEAWSWVEHGVGLPTFLIKLALFASLVLGVPRVWEANPLGGDEGDDGPRSATLG